MAITLQFACNYPDNGMPLGYFEAFEISAGADTISLEGRRCTLSCSDKPMKSVDARIAGGNTLRVGRILVPFWSYRSWYGNWCWDAYSVGWPAALKVLNYLARQKWHCVEGPGEIYEAVNERYAVTPLDWKRMVDGAAAKRGLAK